MNSPFDSRDLNYKSPFGAVKVGTQVKFNVAIPLEYAFSSVTLCFYDNDGYNENVNLAYKFTKDNVIYYGCTFTPKSSRVSFYYFKIQKDAITKYIKRDPYSRGYFTDNNNAPNFQLTVYNAETKTPNFIKGGIYYQIFPDRFNYSGIKKANIPKDRILRSDWGGTPFFMPNSQNEILNDDYFCGDLKGIEQKLPYLESLGVTVIYLNPIFEAHSSHRYNTANYMKIDPLLGCDSCFSELCSTAKKHGISIILDGVFNHTGDDSIYFNKKNRYDSLGAYNSNDSKFYSWYSFTNYPNEYSSWWGFKTLPTINKSNPDFIEYVCGDDGVIKKWLRLGASGFRLDVVDELPDYFIERIRKTIKSEGEEKLLIGEVWEDASNKSAYGQTRKYLLGNQLDGVMNYPFRNAILSYVRTKDKVLFINSILTIVENYPSDSLNVCMNMISTHDVTRAITALAGETEENHDRNWQFTHVLSPSQYEHGVNLLKCAMVLQYFLPGVPCIYYGDEAGLQGYRDPFNRKCYPWGYEDNDILEFTKLLGRLRKNLPALSDGRLNFIDEPEDILAFSRISSSGETLVFLNSNDNTYKLKKNLNGYECKHGEYINNECVLSPYSFAVFAKS